jgi:cell wall-associated NlpC family hydrolase
MAAIDERLGAPYIYGSTGPRGYDCSGFVWSVFHSAGIDFWRGSARTLWARFEPATAEESTQFGTLVFFNGLSHVGIVVDDKGFYHSSRSYGVKDVKKPREGRHKLWLSDAQPELMSPLTGLHFKCSFDSHGYSPWATNMPPLAGALRKIL